MDGRLKSVTNTNPSPFAQGDPGEVWEVKAQTECCDLSSLQAIVFSHHTRMMFAVWLHTEDGRKLPFQFHAVMSGNRLCVIPIKNQFGSEDQKTLHLK